MYDPMAAALEAKAEAYARAGNTREEANARFELGVHLDGAGREAAATRQFAGSADLYETYGDALRAAEAQLATVHSLGLPAFPGEGKQRLKTALQLLDRV